MGYKSLLTGDIHIFDYPAHRLNDDPRFRLNQFPKLAKRLAVIGKEQECNDIIIAGDIMHHSIFEPHIGHVAKEFFKILSESFDNVYYILGQHDINTRAQEKDYNDSLVGIIADFDNVHYMNKKSATIGGKLFAFNDWQPKQDWEWVPENTDVMIGHVTISERFGQDFDNTKFNIGFFGDIHAHGTYLNCVKIGVPIQHTLGDNPEVGVVILDHDDLSWKRVPTIVKGEWEFLQILHEGVEPSVSPEYVRVIKKAPPVKAIKAKLGESLNLMESVADLAAEHDLSDIHSEIINNTKELSSEDDMDLNFDLVKITIKNFRSIEYFEYNFDGGTTLFTGPNGSGKSSFMRALHHAFLPSRSFPVRIDQKEGYVELEVNYQGHIHKIYRGTDGVKYSIGEDHIEAGESQRHINNTIHRNLPFIKYIHLIYHHQKRPGLLSSYSLNDRISLVSNAIGLNKLDPLNTTASKIFDGLNKKLEQYKTDIQNNDVVLDSLEEYVDSSVLDNDYEQLLSDSQSQLTQLKVIAARIRDLNNAKQDLTKIQALIDDNKKISRDTNLESEDSINARIEELSEERRSKRARITEIEAKNQDIRTKVSRGEQIISSIEVDITKTEAKLDKISIDKCYTCGQEIDAERQESLRKDLEGELQALKDKLASAQNIMKSIPDPDTSSISELQSEIDNIASQISELRSSLSRYDEIKRLNSDLARYEERLANKLVEIEEHEDQLAEENNREFNLDSQEVDDKISELTTKISELNTKISYANKVKASIDKIKKIKEENSALRSNVDTTSAICEKYAKYISITSKSGPVVTQVLNNVSELMSDDQVEVVAYKVLKSKEMRPDLSVRLKVGNNFIPYDELSGGQQVFSDIVFLTKLIQIIGKSGMLILDETLKEVDKGKVEQLVAYLQETPIGNMFISTHVDSFNYYDKHIAARLIDGVSEYVEL